MQALGTILPSANTVVERTTIAMLSGLPVAPIFTRIPKRGSADSHPDRHDTETLLEAASLLADARPAAIVLSQGKGAAIGLRHDRALVAAIATRTGIPAATPGLTAMDALHALDATKVAVIGPHDAAFNARVARGFAAEGVEVITEAGLGLTDNLSFAAVEATAIAGLARQVAHVQGVQAILAWNTNCLAAPLAPLLEAELEVPFLDATALGILGGLRAAGIAARPGPAWGRLFTLGI